MNIIKTKNDIEFRLDGTEDYIYHIRKEEWPLVMESHEEGISECINQLHEKRWIEPEDLYKLAKIINKECPDNKIDWIASLYMVEQRSYVKAKQRINASMRPANQKWTIFDSVMEVIDIGRNISPEIQKQIEYIIEDKLKKYCVI